MLHQNISVALEYLFSLLVSIIHDAVEHEAGAEIVFFLSVPPSLLLFPCTLERTTLKLSKANLSCSSVFVRYFERG